MIEQLYPYLILSGSTIGLVLFYLWRQTQRINRINLALIQLNQELNFDTPAFLKGAWKLLSQAGWRGIDWQLEWFGIPIEGQAGQRDGGSVTRQIRIEDMHLTITLYHKNYRGERRYFNQNLFETFLLLLHTDMWIKAGTTHASFTEMAKLNLFLQHDMKNIAQFIQLMADQLTSVPPGKERQVLDYLRSAAPLVRQRADRIVQTLIVKQPQADSMRSFRLHDELEQLSRLYRLDCSINGQATIRAPENSLDSALDNILKNYSDIAQREGKANPRLEIVIAESDDSVHLTIESSDSTPAEQVERLFEPFWSNNPAGLGIGLYQARHLLQSCNGKLDAEHTATGQIRFHLWLPLIVSPP